MSGVDRQLDRPPSIVDEEGATNEIPFPSFLMLSTRFALIKHPAWLSLKYSVFRSIHIIPTSILKLRVDLINANDVEASKGSCTNRPDTVMGARNMDMVAVPPSLAADLPAYPTPGWRQQTFSER